MTEDFERTTMNSEQKTSKRPLLPALFVTLGVTSMMVSACNTVEGAGRDIEAAGDAIADTAEDASD